jgi:hypothetical protein
MKNRLRDRHAVFDESYRRFFFLDEHPEIAQRFSLSFDRCFQEAVSASRDVIARTISFWTFPSVR